MTNESICVRCAELVRVKVKRKAREEYVIEEESMCSIGVIQDTVFFMDTVQECSRFVQVPGEVEKK